MVLNISENSDKIIIYVWHLSAYFISVTTSDQINTYRLSAHCTNILNTGKL
jgi:hypothetical protein